jgi:hypothetical protein
LPAQYKADNPENWNYKERFFFFGILRRIRLPQSDNAFPGGGQDVAGRRRPTKQKNLGNKAYIFL